MFPHGYFAAGYFAPEYWPPIVVVSSGGRGLRTRITTKSELPDLLAQIQREDEEILMVITLAVQEGFI
jgi:hypothetical protein